VGTPTCHSISSHSIPLHITALLPLSVYQPTQLGSTTTTLWTGRSGDGIPVGEKFNVMSIPVLVLTQNPVQRAKDPFPGCKEAGAWH